MSDAFYPRTPPESLTRAEREAWTRGLGVLPRGLLRPEAHDALREYARAAAHLEVVRNDLFNPRGQFTLEDEAQALAQAARAEARLLL